MSGEFFGHPSRLVYHFQTFRIDGGNVHVIFCYPCAVIVRTIPREAQAYFPDASYVMVSLMDQDAPVVRGFRIREGDVLEREVVIR